MFLVIVLSALSQANAQIHRASSQSNYQIKYDSNFTLQYFLKKLQTQSTRDMFSLLDHYSFLAEASGGVRLIWITSVLAALLVGVCGVLPALLLPRLANDQRSLMDSAKFKLMMCFAAGSLLGDVFLHLLPEAYSTNVTPEQTANGLWTLFGVSVFFTVEKLFQDEETESDTNMQMLDENNNKLTKKSKQRKKRKSSDSNVVSIKVKKISYNKSGILKEKNFFLPSKMFLAVSKSFLHRSKFFLRAKMFLFDQNYLSSIKYVLYRSNILKKKKNEIFV